MLRPEQPLVPAFVAPSGSSEQRAERKSESPGSRARALRELAGAPVAGVGFLFRAWAAIFAVEASLRLAGYKSTLAWIEALPERRPRKRKTSVFLGERLVRGAYRGHVLRGGCLPKSLVQYLLHRRDGTAARFVIGVRRPDPNETRSPGIEAHAWVESVEDAAPASVPLGTSAFTPIYDGRDA